MSHVYFGEIASAARLAEVQGEIELLHALAPEYRAPIAMSYLREEERVLLTEIQDREIGLCWVTFKWGVGSASIDSKYLRVPASEIRRLKLTDSIADMVGMSPDKKHYYILLRDSNEIYEPRKAEGRPICRLDETFVEGTPPYTVMVSLYDLRNGRVALKRGKKVHLKY